MIKEAIIFGAAFGLGWFLGDSIAYMISGEFDSPETYFIVVGVAAVGHWFGMRKGKS